MNQFVNPASQIFISYARSDGESFARQIHERLEVEHNLTCWRDRLDLEGGESFWRQLEAGIGAARWVLIVLTPGALKSEWTAREWREARKRGVPICPVWPLSANELGTQLERSTLPAGMQRSHGTHHSRPVRKARSTRKRNGATSLPLCAWRNTLRVPLHGTSTPIRLR